MSAPSPGRYTNGDNLDSNPFAQSEFPLDDSADDTGEIDAVDETLVAYLDGELQESERLDLEQRLSSDESLRGRLAELQSGWELLDALPPAHVTEDFARTTVELVAATQSKLMVAQSRSQPLQRLGWLAVTILATIVFSLIGYLIPQRLERLEERRLLDQLILAENLDAYLVELDLQLVEQLANDSVWQEYMRLASDAGGIVIPESLDLADRESDKRLALVKEASRTVQANLSTNWDRMQSLSDTKMEFVEQRASQIAETTNPRRTLKTLEQYARWWQQLSPPAKDRVLRASLDEKILVIREEVQRNSRRWVQNYAMTLGDTDRIPIQQQLLLIASHRIEQAKALVTRELAEKGLDLDPENLHWWSLTPERLLHFFGRPWFPQPVSPEIDPIVAKAREVLFSPLSEEELGQVEDLLSRQALAILYVESGSDDERRETLSRWCAEIVQGMAPWNNNSFKTLFDYYQVPDDETRELLDLKRPERMIEELRARRFYGPRP